MTTNPRLIRAGPRSSDALAAGTAVVTRGFGSALQLGLSVLLGRLAGAEGAGLYFVYLSWANVWGTVTSLGLPLYSLRSVSALVALSQHSSARHLVARSLRLVGIASLAVAIVVFAIGDRILGVFGSGNIGFAARLAVLAGISLAALRVIAETLKARGQANLGITVEYNAPPSLLIAALLVASIVEVPIGGRAAAAGHAIFITAVFMAAAAYVFSSWSAGSWIPATPAAGKIQVRPLTTFWGISLISYGLMAAPYLVLPLFATEAEIGRYGVAHRLVAVSATTVVALASVFAPAFTRHQMAGDMEELRKAFRLSQFYLVATYLPLFLVYVVFSNEVLALFGSDFTPGRDILLILAVGRLVYSSAGLSEYLLNMTGKETWELWNGAFTLAAFCAGSVFLGSQMGAHGVAWAHAGAFSLRSVVSLALAQWTLRRSA